MSKNKEIFLKSNKQTLKPQWMSNKLKFLCIKRSSIKMSTHFQLFIGCSDDEREAEWKVTSLRGYKGGRRLGWMDGSLNVIAHSGQKLIFIC